MVMSLLPFPNLFSDGPDDRDGICSNIQKQKMLFFRGYSKTPQCVLNMGNKKHKLV